MSMLKMSNPKLSNEVLIRSKKTLKPRIKKALTDIEYIQEIKKNAFIPTSLYTTELLCEQKNGGRALCIHFYIIPTLLAYLWCAIPTYLYIFIYYF